ncbi:MAG: RtcB family protein [Firmicutes bacterium]|nr:RtcB family protein [Bacillota bacterium]
MQKMKGTYAAATVYSHTVEDYALKQIEVICNHEVAEGSRIAIMPDVHPGKVGPIGLTMTLGSKIMPILLGTDIGCGISYMKIKQNRIEYQKLDTVIRENIPVGSKIRDIPHLHSKDFDFKALLCQKHVSEKKAVLSLGTLGGGNHFIEADRDEEGNLYVFVHTGSRRLGAEVTEFYLKEGQRRLKRRGVTVPYELTWLEGQLMEDYLNDVREMQNFAMVNRKIILSELAKQMKWKAVCFGESIHNYVDENGILRKGAAAAYENDEVIIPVNMRDGIILARGKGNPAWNFSVPHGSGRVSNRETVKIQHTVREFKDAMKGIYSATIGKETLDEAPFAYRGMEEILEAIQDTAEVKKILKPLYNYRAMEKR